ncbi:MAG TPA: protein kinase [Candidatus Acidoferrales bacterium]|nr:protein kinase [Candidatus Acidoferrales bacterium]
MSLSIGDKLGPYEILAPIGAGGMGEVWKARDTRLDRIVAIKQLKGQHTARFEQEARVIAALNHPHICQLYDIGPDYLVLEYVEGEPPKGPLPPAEAVRLALEIAGALEEAHRRGILHRDLKPANILVTKRGGVKLLDFGLAKLMADADTDVTQTMEGTVLGTAAYMAPEQAEGKPVDARAEIFSFGAVLYEILSGNRAFRGNSTGTVLSAVLRDDPAPLQTTTDLQRIVARCLSKQPQDRFPSVTDLRVALEQVGASKPADQKPSIAVLPFANMSRDADDEYFSDGLAEEIINALVKVPGLRVIARTSAFAFKGQNTDIRKIAETLGVTNILEGSVRRAGNRIRVTAQLITAADGSHLWSERYDRQMEDIFAVQDEISAAIASALKLKLSPEPTALHRHQPNLQAYEAYLRYRQYQWSLTPESLRRSRECLEQAIALDPEFALPYVGLADHHLSQTWVGMPPDEAMPRARKLAQRALELDPDLPEAHGMLGIVAGQYDLDWKEAERRFRLATARDPVPWHVRAWYSCFYLLPVGRLEEARQEAERALEDNPLSQMVYWCLAITLEGLGLEREARAAEGKVVELDPQFWLGWWLLGMHQGIRGRRADVRDCAEKAFAIFPSSPNNIGLLAGVLRSEGETARAEALLAQSPAGSYGAPVARVCCYLVCDEIDAALEWAGKAVGERNPTFIQSVIRPFEKVLRKSPGWPAFLKKLNLPEASASSSGLSPARK